MNVPLIFSEISCRWVNKTNLVLFVGIMVGILSFIIGTTYKKSGIFEGYTGYSGDMFIENFSPKFTSEVSFFVVVGVFFPAVTGIDQGIVTINSQVFMVT